MAPGQPARAPIPPSLAVCVERPFGFHALTVWISRRRSMTWAIGDLCRFSLLNLGSKKHAAGTKEEITMGLY